MIWDRFFTFLAPKHQQPLPAPVVQETAHHAGSYRPVGLMEEYNPDELPTKRGKDVYAKMLRDDQVKAAYELTNTFVLGRTWRFALDEDNDQHAEMAEFFEHML